MDRPKVSIIVPIYNVEKYLDRCIQSLLNQTLKELEIIMVDDESPDNCPAMCDEYASQDSRIKVIHKRNGGLGLARNDGLEVATGEYVAFVDSDDFVSLEMFERIYDQAQSIDLDLVFCNYYYYKDNLKRECRDIHSNLIFKDKDEISHLLLDMVGTLPVEPLDRKFTMSVWHGIYRRDIIEKNNIRFLSEREVVSEDLFFHVKFIKQCGSIGYIPECYYFYCENGASLSKSYRKDRFQKYVMLHKRAYELLLETYPDQAEEIQLRVDRLFLGYVRNMLLVYNNPNTVYKEIFENSYMCKIIDRYPYYMLPLRYRFFVYLIKYRIVSLIKLMNKTYKP